MRGIDFTLWLQCADNLPLIILGGVEELISYSIIMEESHLSPRKIRFPDVMLIDNLGGCDTAGHWDLFNQPAG